MASSEYFGYPVNIILLVPHINLSLMLYNLSKWQVSLNNAPKSNKWYIKLFESNYKVAGNT